jgi:protein-S-isoprenylcysteine O-methyltransferase Ste14
LIGLWLFLGSLTPVFIIPVFSWLIQKMFVKEEEQILEAKARLALAES